MLEEASYRPKIFYTEGPLRGEEEPFPEPTTAIRPRSDVLFSRDNAGLPHRPARPDSPSSNESPRATLPSRKPTPPGYGQDSLPSPSLDLWREAFDGEKPYPAVVPEKRYSSPFGDISCDDLDFSKLTLREYPTLESTRFHPNIKGKDHLPAWLADENSTAGTSAMRTPGIPADTDFPTDCLASWSLP